jgi:hypothetical protein
MSWGTCYSGSNNIHFKEPALMSDSRLYTHYGSNCKANNSLKKDLGLNSNYDYRQYLIKNGNRLMERNQNDHINKVGYQSPYNISNLNLDKKHIYKNVGDNSQPYGYETSDLKNMYLSRYELQAKSSGPIVTQEELLQMKARQ